MTEAPCEKKENTSNPCSEPPTDSISKIMAAYDQMDKGELSDEDAVSKIAEILKERRQAKLECLKKLGAFRK